MPNYAFVCSTCEELRFTRVLKMGDHPTHACPSCGEQAPRLWDGTGFGFSFAQGGSSTANSGVHDHDYPSADKVVGRSAEDRWGRYMERHKIKQKVRQQAHTGALVRSDGEGYSDYTSMTSEQKAARSKLVDLAVKTGARKAQ